MHVPGFGVLRARISTPFFHPHAVVWWSCLLLRAVVSMREAKTLAIIPFGGRVKGRYAAIRFARLQYPGLESCADVAISQNFPPTEMEKCGCLLGSTLLFVHWSIARRYAIRILFGKSAIPFVPRQSSSRLGHSCVC
jgi:hypothetical protein